MRMWQRPCNAKKYYVSILPIHRHSLYSHRLEDKCSLLGRFHTGLTGRIHHQFPEKGADLLQAICLQAL